MVRAASKNINIVGERKGRYIANNDKPSAKFGSIIKYIGTENATMLTQGASDWYLTWLVKLGICGYMVIKFTLPQI